MLGGEERRRHNTTQRDVNVRKKGGTVLCGLFSVSSLNRVARGVKTELFAYSLKNLVIHDTALHVAFFCRNML